ncbi:hypothetical protein BJ322DRAFT_1047861 [Thelephora terrestris]|uniref:Zn(2)-C6 fungal-type domain-containing protein n=1 Tax=Thelephora terrestris TaxID=56493 RepID=A0A9P6HKU2_9AGAM|nr:hypothetical protein BJ322DRAFT_1047861 [Thelephora terrestris]
MSANGEQAAAHKQQQSPPAPMQPPSQSSEHIHPPAFVQLAPHPGAYALPPGAFSPVFFGHPNPEGMVNHDPNVPQYMPYTQMMYVYPPPIPGQAPPFPHPGVPQPTAVGKQKRKQVKMACTNCASACKKCDDGRPCQRCIRSNLASTCKDGVRKERKRGIKRGPYKRRNKPPSDDEADVPREQASIPPTLPEGYFPYFLPPPGYFQGAEGQNGAPPVQVPFYPYHHPLTPFPYSAGIPMPFMQPLSGQPGPSHNPIEAPQPPSAKGKRQRSSTDELSTSKKSKTDDQRASGTPDSEGNDVTPSGTEPAAQPSEPPSSDR